MPHASDHGLPPVPSPALVHVVGAAIVRDGRCLVTRRGPEMSEPRRWEFPGGKVEPGENPIEALAREIMEELRLEIEPGNWLGRGFGRQAQRILCLDVFLARVQDGQDLRLEQHCEHGWFGPDELAGLDWPEADRPIVPPLRRYLLEEPPRA